MKYLRTLPVIAFAFIAFGSRAVHAEGPPKRPFKGYGSYAPDFHAICTAIADDGRLSKLLEVTKAHSERDPECDSCRPLMQQFSISCGSVIKPPKLPKKEAKPADTEVPADDATPTPTATATPYPNQREPSTVTLDRITQLFSKVAEDKDSNVRAIPGIQKLIFLLRDKHVMKPGAEADYFDELAEYMYAPFADLAETQAKSDQKTLEANPEKKEKSLGSMFDE